MLIQNIKKNSVKGLMIIAVLILLSCHRNKLEEVENITPVIQYSLSSQKMYGGNQLDSPSAHVTTKDGGIVVVGTTETNSNSDVPATKGYSDVWIVKLDANGNIVWSKTYGGEGWESASAITSTLDGGFIVIATVGELSSKPSGDVGPTHQGWDTWIIKLDKDGNLVKQKTLGGDLDDFGLSIIEATDGSLFMAGSTNSIDGDLAGIPSFGNADAWLIKFDYDLNILWQKKMGGTGPDSFTSLVQSRDGNILLGSHTQSNNGQVTGSHVTASSPGVINGDYWVVKTNLSGTLLWAKAFGGTKDDWPNSIIELSNGNILVSGSTLSSDGDVTGYHNVSDHGISNISSDAWIVSISSSGNLIWEKCYGGYGDENITSATVANANTLLLLGLTNSNNGDVSGGHGLTDAWVLEITSAGKLNWQKCLGGTSLESGRTISISTDGTVTLTVDSSSNDGDVSGNHGFSDYWIVKLK